MSVSSTLTSAVMTRHVGEGHEGGALGILDAFDDGFAFADRLIGDDAIEGSDGDGPVQAGPALKLEVGDLGLQVAAGGRGLCLGLDKGGHGLREGGDVEVVGGLFGVEILLGDDLGL